MKIGFVACAAKKHLGMWPAKDLYTSHLFQKAYSFAVKNCDSVFILSAKYGLVKPEQVIESYDLTLNNFTERGREVWARKVYADIITNTKATDEMYWFAGVNYRKYLMRLLPNIHHEPVKGLGIGSQMKWYKDRL